MAHVGLSEQDERTITFVAVMLASWTNEAGKDIERITEHGRAVMRNIALAQLMNRPKHKKRRTK